MDEWGDEISTQYNYRVRQPQAPRSEVIEGEKEFGGQAPDWLGAPVDRENWGRGIKVAVIDSGIDASHPALKGAEVAEISLIKGEAPSPGHGTAVASIIVGNSENQKGIAPAASILSVRVLNKDGEGDSFTVARGIVEAVDRGADVINMSLGGDASSSVLEQAVQYAQSRGVSVVAAVGNEGQEGVAYPARYDGVVGVTSLDANGQSSGFANYGKGVDIGAPGVGVYTAWADEEIVSFSGTSTASAFVAGVLAAELSKNPGVPREKIVDLLYEYANESEKPGFDQYTGHGALNVARIENRFDPYLADAAIVGYYFDPLDFGKPNVPFLVSVQNQGTLWLKNVELEVDYMGLSRKFVISNLNPGEVKSEQLLLDRGKGREGVRIQSRLRVQGRDDLNPENNERASTITLPSN
jgi:subtilisin family serine protease